MVFVTGLGLITACGNDVESNWEKLCSGFNGITKIPYWNCDIYPNKLAGIIKNFDPSHYLSAKKMKRTDYCHQLGLAAASMAIDDANIAPFIADYKRVGIFLGTSLGGILSGQKYHQQFLTKKSKNPFLAMNYPMQVLLDKLTEEFNFLGPRTIVSTACTASTIAIAQAVSAIRSGQLDCALVGGVDPLCELSFAGFSSMKNMSTEPCAPFSTPIGLNLGEGAGMLILESREHANKRKAKIYAEIGGIALSADAYHPTSPDASAMGQKNLLIQVLADSHEKIEAIDYINTHGTGTSGNDSIEVKGIKLAFGTATLNTQISSSKGSIGHTLGAAGAIEAIITVLSVFHNTLPPTANFKETRLGCDLNHVKNTSQQKIIHKAITQNFAFGGNNAALLIRKPTKHFPPEAKKFTQCVITGFDVISPTGIGKLEFLNALKNRISAVDKNAEGVFIKNFDPKKLSHANFRRSDRIGDLTICIAEMALKNANFSSVKEIGDSAGLIFGSDGPIETTRLFHEPIALGKGHTVNPGLFPNTVLNAGIGLASIHLKLKGPNIALNVGESSGLRALSQAYDCIQSNRSEKMICGAVDEQNDLRLKAFEVIKNKIFKRTKRDFRNKRNIALAEGAAAFVFESLPSATLRNTKIFAEIIGYGNIANSTQGDLEKELSIGIYHSMRAAILSANIHPKEIDFICSGSLSVENDRFEQEAFAKVFECDMPVFTPVKYFGLSGASALLGMAAVLLAFEKEISFENLVDNPKMKLLFNKEVKVCLINSISIGNNNVSILIKKYEKECSI